MYIGKNKIITELQKNARSEWPRFHCELNTWHIPEELEHLNIGREYGDLRSIICEAMEYISDEVGQKVISHYWNTIHCRNSYKLTEEQFEIWWNNGGKCERTAKFSTVKDLFNHE